MYDALKYKTLLYVEDDSTVRENLAQILDNFFARVIVASTAEEAWRLYQRENIDIAIVDIELPGMNGLELIRLIKERQPDIPVVIVSAYTTTDYLLESIELKLDKYVVKPLTSRKLYELMDKLNNEFKDDNLLYFPKGAVVDVSKSTITFNNKSFPLTYRELKMMKILYEKRAISYEELYSLWRDIPSDNAVRSFIKQLRKKLPEGLLKVRSKIGYVLEEPQ
ncbi:MAG: response regulator [Epsilonproteobacteria bacterium]|nr:response regulator [Campylobacterota bacterium]